MLGLAPWHGRILVLDRDDAAESTGHGSPLPMLVHGGPGRAGGAISRYEWRGETAPFSSVDRNNDNVVTRDEYAAVYGGVPGTDPASYAREQRFRVLDRNNNGEISRGEVGAVNPSPSKPWTATGTTTSPATST